MIWRDYLTEDERMRLVDDELARERLRRTAEDRIALISGRINRLRNICMQRRRRDPSPSSNRI